MCFGSFLLRFCWLIQLESAEIEIDWHFVIVVGRFAFRFVLLSCLRLWIGDAAAVPATVEIFFERYSVRHI